MKRGKTNSLHIEVKSFLQNKKRPSHQTKTHPGEETLDALLGLCPAASLADCIQSTPCLRQYERDIFAAPGTPFGDYGISSYLKFVEFVAERHPRDYSQKLIEHAAVKKAKTAEIHSTLKEKANRTKALALLFDDVRDPALWHAQPQKFTEISNLVSSTAHAVENGQYIVNRCISGVFSDFFYKSIISTKLLAHLAIHSTSDEFVQVVAMRIAEILRTLNDADPNAVAHANLPGLEGIKPLKLYAGALLLVAVLRAIDKRKSAEASVDSSIQFQTCCTIHARCPALRGWCFSALCAFLMDGKEGVADPGVLPLAAYVHASAQKADCPELNLLARYLRPRAIPQASLPADLARFLDEDVSQDVLSEESIADLLKSIQKPQGFLQGHSHVHRHPLLADFSKEMHRRCASEAAEEVTGRVYAKLIRKLDFAQKVESMAGKFLCDAMCHCVLAFGVGPAANQAIFTYYTFALESFGSYSLPAVKTTTALSHQVVPAEGSADFYRGRIDGLLRQFTDLDDGKYTEPVNKPSMDDFTVDSSDDDEEATPDTSLALLGMGENTQRSQSSVVHFLRDHVIRMVQHAALHATVCPQTLQKIFRFLLSVALPARAVAAGSTPNIPAPAEIDVAHRLLCMNSLACVICPTNRSTDHAKPDVPGEETSNDTPSRTKQKVLLGVLDDLSISENLRMSKQTYLAFLSAAQSPEADVESVQLCVLLALRGAWEDLVNRTSDAQESCDHDMNTIACALKQLVEALTPTSGRSSLDILNTTFHEAFHRLYMTVAMAPHSQKFSARLAESMEQFCCKHYSTIGDPEVRSRFSPILCADHFRGKAIQGLLDANALPQKDSSRKTTGSLAEDVVHNLHALRLFSVIFSQLNDAIQAEMVFRWIACFYALSGSPVVQAKESRDIQRLLEEIARNIKFHPTVSVHSTGLYADASMQTPYSNDAEAQWSSLLSLFLTILRIQMKNPENYRWVKETCSTILRKLYSGIVMSAEAPNVHNTPKSPVSPLIASLQAFFRGLIECRTFPTQGKQHFLSCIPQNAAFSAVFILPTLTDYVLRACGNADERTNDSPSVFDCQCIQLVLDIYTQTMRKLEKSEVEQCREVRKTAGKAFIMSFATASVQTFQRMCSKSFMEICGPSLYRVLSILKKTDAESANHVKVLYEKSMKYIEKHRIPVLPKHMRQIRDYMHH